MGTWRGNKSILMYKEMSLRTTLYLKVNAKSARKCIPTGKCPHVGMFKTVHSIRGLEILPYRNEEWRQPDIVKTSNDAKIITLKLNPSRGTVLPAPYGKENKCDFTRSRQIIRYRATATLRQLQIKQYSASNEGGGVSQTNGNILKFDDRI